MNTRNKRKKINRRDMKSKIIDRQTTEIENLKGTISDLEIDCEQKDALIHSIDSLRNEMLEVVDELKSKGDEYDKLMDDLIQMRNVMNHDVFNGRWKIIKWLLK